MDEKEFKCAIASLHKKVSTYQQYVEECLFKHKQACKEDYDYFLSELNDALDKAIAQQESIIGGGSQ